MGRNTGRPPRLSCFECPTRTTAAWRVLPDEAQAVVDRHKRTYAFAPASTVFQAGEPNEGLWCIHRGSLALRRSDANGNSVLVQLVHERETLGAYEYFTSADYVASAETLTDCVICHIDGAQVRGLIDAHPPLSMAFMERLAEELEQAHETYLRVSTLPLRQRLAHLVLALAPHFGRSGEAGATVVELPMTQQTMADLLGVRRESVVRAFHALEEDGLLRFEDRAVVVRDPARLEGELEAELHPAG